ncbi:MAG: hypothetical protein M1819_004378 [Sarea resinae]|nr:MAG: hypothetical protein M1819_004378 [Sarea resinae]
MSLEEDNNQGGTAVASAATASTVEEAVEEGPNEYEQRVARMRAENQKLLSDLATSVAAVKQPAKAPVPTIKKRKSPLNIEVPASSRRRSTRIQARELEIAQEAKIAKDLPGTKGPDTLLDDAAEGIEQGVKKRFVARKVAKLPKVDREPYAALGTYRVIAERPINGQYIDHGIRDEQQPTPPGTTEVTPMPEEEASGSQSLEADGRTRTVLEDEDLVASKVFGEIANVPVGTWWEKRTGPHAALIHRGLVKGIFAGEEGCYSVVLSGGYDDDLDEGESFTYTGEGGRDLNRDPVTGKPRDLRTAAQSKPQIMSGGNLALKINCQTGRPVRVVRGYKGRNIWSPSNGYRYDGGQAPIDLTAGPGSWSQPALDVIRDRAAKAAAASATPRVAVPKAKGGKAVKDDKEVTKNAAPPIPRAASSIPRAMLNMINQVGSSEPLDEEEEEEKIPIKAERDRYHDDFELQDPTGGSLGTPKVIKKEFTEEDA